jgi:hypothetical protein
MNNNCVTSNDKRIHRMLTGQVSSRIHWLVCLAIAISACSFQTSRHARQGLALCSFAVANSAELSIRQLVAECCLLSSVQRTRSVLEFVANDDANVVISSSFDKTKGQWSFKLGNIPDDTEGPKPTRRSVPRAVAFGIAKPAVFMPNSSSRSSPPSVPSPTLFSPPNTL